MEEKYLENRIYLRRNTERNTNRKVKKYAGGKDTIVFIHGISGSSSAWADFEKFFENKYDILTFDLRGHGKSFKYSKFSEYQLTEYAEDLYWLLKKEKIKQFTLVSHSFGNLVALEFLKKHPEVVTRIVLLSAGHNPSTRLGAKLLKPFLWVFSKFDIFPIRTQGWHVDYSNYVMTGDWNLKRMFADVRNTTLRVFLYSTLQSYYVNSSDFLKEITQPTLIIHGEKDTIFPLSQAKDMCSEIPNCSLVTMPNADHILVLNYFSEVSKIISDFMEKNEEK